MRVYEAIGETLKKLEVQATFGLMGDGNLRFMTHLAEELGIPYYAARHEGGAVSMADGYARVSGKVGVCSVTQGPGVTNTERALITGQHGTARSSRLRRGLFSATSSLLPSVS
jgi:thiamine pyrophosphate-dependent acetolactate synthase large subunit-like protein